MAFMRIQWKSLVPGVLLSLMLAGSGAFADNAESLTSLAASARATIDSANAAWVPAMQRADADAVAAPYAANGIFIAPDGKCIKGRIAIRDFYKGRLASIARVLGGQVTQQSLTAAGGRLYESGHASMSLELRNGTRKTSGGEYLTVWERNASGHWEIIRNLAL